MRKDLDRRLRKLEAAASVPGSYVLELLYLVLTGKFGPEFQASTDALLEQFGRKADYLPPMDNLRERGIVDLLILGTEAPFDIERFRGLVPDRCLAATYSFQRNHGFDPATALRVRQLAGVVDRDGAPLQGYVLADNGCILAAGLG